MQTLFLFAVAIIALVVWAVRHHRKLVREHQEREREHHSLITKRIQAGEIELH